MAPVSHVVLFLSSDLEPGRISACRLRMRAEGRGGLVRLTRLGERDRAHSHRVPVGLVRTSRWVSRATSIRGGPMLLRLQDRRRQKASKLQVNARTGQMPGCETSPQPASSNGFPRHTGVGTWSVSRSDPSSVACTISVSAIGSLGSTTFASRCLATPVRRPRLTRLCVKTVGQMHRGASDRPLRAPRRVARRGVPPQWQNRKRRCDALQR